MPYLLTKNNIMKDYHILGAKLKSKINYLAKHCKYEIIKLNKTTCHVRLWEEDNPTEIIYKGIRYHTLIPS